MEMKSELGGSIGGIFGGPFEHPKKSQHSGGGEYSYLLPSVGSGKSTTSVTVTGITSQTTKHDHCRSIVSIVCRLLT